MSNITGCFLVSTSPSQATARLLIRKLILSSRRFCQQGRRPEVIFAKKVTSHVTDLKVDIWRLWRKTKTREGEFILGDLVDFCCFPVNAGQSTF